MGQLEQTLRDLVHWHESRAGDFSIRPWREARELVTRLDYLDHWDDPRVPSPDAIEIPPEALHGFPWTAEEVARDAERPWTVEEILAREG